MNRVFYGDIHGCIDELKALYEMVEKEYPGIEHWHTGDMVDRGPDSGAVIEFCMKNFTGGVMGNHEDTILKGYDSFKKYGRISRNPDKARTISQLNEERVEYMQSLPYLHLFDDVKLALVHGGLLPKINWWEQPPLISCRLQMFNKKNPSGYRLRWWGGDAKHQPKVGKTESQSRAEGYVRWYEEWDHEYSVIYGHSVMGLLPYIHQNNKGTGKTIGIDTGSCFGGYLTAIVYPEMRIFRMPCKEYIKGKNVRNFKEILWENPENNKL